MFERERLESGSGAALDEAWSSYAPEGPLSEQTCVFPRCGAAADRYDVDLRVGGGSPGSAEVDVELWPLCYAHYQVKQLPGWSISRHPSGTIIWRTPDGRYHLKYPPRPTQPAPRPAEDGHGLQ